MKQRVRARAVALRQDNAAAWLAVVALAAGLLAAAAAQGQSAPGQSAPQVPPDTSSPAAPGTADAGVIRPPAQVDPGIQKRPAVPPAALPTPVIPPPGAPGGNPAVQPK